MLEELGDVSQSQRNQKLRLIFNSIVSESIEGTDYNARVKSFFGGNEFYLMKYITYNDVRLVGAPPSSIGKYGGDTDNWMWPWPHPVICITSILANRRRWSSYQSNIIICNILH